MDHYIPAAFPGLGTVAPSGLCLDRIRDDLPDRRSTYAAAATLWLSWLLARLDDEMVKDSIETRLDITRIIDSGTPNMVDCTRREV